MQFTACSNGHVTKSRGKQTSDTKMNKMTAILSNFKSNIYFIIRCYAWLKAVLAVNEDNSIYSIQKPDIRTHLC